MPKGPTLTNRGWGTRKVKGDGTRFFTGEARSIEMSSSRFFVTGTDTGVGKTVVSALLCAALDAIYWKPIQTGTREGADRPTVMRLAGLPRARTAPEAYRFAPPVSPHLAARRAGVRIDFRKIAMPQIAASENLIAEGAGGALVPINERQLMTDLMRHLGLPVLLVTRTTLGTINHTLLSLAALRAAGLDVCGVIMVGKANRDNREAIERYGSSNVVGFVPRLARIDRGALLRVFKKHFDATALEGGS
ncbi:MAG: dethiobiotin synthase [Candidatus Acidiferrales bacterium]